MTVDQMYFYHNSGRCLQQVQTPLSLKAKNVLSHFFKIFEIYINFCAYWKKIMSFIASIFQRLLTLKNVVAWMLESSSSRTSFWSQRVDGSQTLTKSTHLHFPIPCILVIIEISCCNRSKRHYLQNQKKFCHIFFRFSKST